MPGIDLARIVVASSSSRFVALARLESKRGRREKRGYSIGGGEEGREGGSKTAAAVEGELGRGRFRRWFKSDACVSRVRGCPG